MEDLCVFSLTEFPENIRLIGDSKFKTPRLEYEKVPIIILPEGFHDGISMFGEKKFLNISFSLDKKNNFEKIKRWMNNISENVMKQVYPFIHEFEGFISMKVKLPSEFSVIDMDGLETSSFHASYGSKIRCVVEIPCVWENCDNVGLSIQMVQCKVLESKKCMINSEII
jgi:hypothetical protein